MCALVRYPQMLRVPCPAAVSFLRTHNICASHGRLCSGALHVCVLCAMWICSGIHAYACSRVFHFGISVWRRSLLLQMLLLRALPAAIDQSECAHCTHCLYVCATPGCACARVNATPSAHHHLSPGAVCVITPAERTLRARARKNSKISLMHLRSAHIHSHNHTRLLSVGICAHVLRTHEHTDKPFLNGCACSHYKFIGNVERHKGMSDCGIYNAKSITRVFR